MELHNERPLKKRAKEKKGRKEGSEEQIKELLRERWGRGGEGLRVLPASCDFNTPASPPGARVFAR